MRTRRIYDKERHAHFLTFSCYKRRRLLDVDRAKKIVLGVLNSQLSRQRGRCAGFVVMPNHVHAIVWFPEDDQISEFVKEWKKRSSVQIKRLLRTGIASYGRTINADEPVWQAGFYDFNIYSPKKLRAETRVHAQQSRREGTRGRSERLAVEFRPALPAPSTGGRPCVVA